MIVEDEMSMREQVRSNVHLGQARWQPEGTFNLVDCYTVVSSMASLRAKALLEDPALLRERVLHDTLGEPAASRIVRYISPHEMNKLTEQSPSPRSQQSQSHGRCCGQQQERSRHGWCLWGTHVFNARSFPPRAEATYQARRQGGWSHRA